MEEARASVLSHDGFASYIFPEGSHATGLVCYYWEVWTVWSMHVALFTFEESIGCGTLPPTHTRLPAQIHISAIMVCFSFETVSQNNLSFISADFSNTMFISVPITHKYVQISVPSRKNPERQEKNCVSRQSNHQNQIQRWHESE